MCDNTCDHVGDSVCAESTRKEIQAAQPLLTSGCQSTLGKPIPQGQTGKEVKPVGVCATGKGEGKRPHKPREAGTTQVGGEGYCLTQAGRGAWERRGCSVSMISRAEFAKCLSWKPARVPLCPQEETSVSPMGPGWGSSPAPSSTSQSGVSFLLSTRHEVLKPQAGGGGQVMSS